MMVISGAGRVQRSGGPIEDIGPGDVVWFAPDEKHWHGASPTTAMTHIAIAEALNGKVVDWMEHVSDEQIPRLMISTRNRMQPTRAIASSAKRCAR